MTDTTCLQLSQLLPAGRALHLRPGDRLCRINGLPFTGGAEALAERFAAARPLALGFRRGEADVTLLAETPALGRWESVPAPVLPEGPRLHPEVLRNWEVLAAPDATYDLQPLSGSRSPGSRPRSGFCRCGSGACGRARRGGGAGLRGCALACGRRSSAGRRACGARGPGLCAGGSQTAGAPAGGHAGRGQRSRGPCGMAEARAERALSLRARPASARAGLGLRRLRARR